VGNGAVVSVLTSSDTCASRQEPRFNFIEIKEQQIRKSGVYFLSKEKKITYIGKSIDVFNRPFQHKACRVFDKVKILEAAVEWIDYLESAFVGKYRPIENGRQHKEKATSSDYSVSDNLAFNYCHQALQTYAEFELKNFVGENYERLTVEDAHKNIRNLTLDYTKHNSKKLGSQKERKAAMRRIIDSYMPYQLFSEHHVSKINDITGWTFTGYKKVTNREFPTDDRCIAHTNDGTTWTIWSWNKAIVGESSLKNLTQAMRNSVIHQVGIYRATSRQVCSACGSHKNLNVDHKTKPFSLIKNEFIEKNPNIIHSIESRGNGWNIFWPELKTAWQKFHEAHADYQVLCSSCNSRKGTKCP
jgi:hypothetical protein